MPSRFRDNMMRDSAWMTSIATNRLLHGFRNNAGVFAGREGGYMTVKKLGGWESLDCELRGHTTGHLSLGYMPVKQEAFDACLPEAIKELSDPMYVSLYQAFLDTQENYTFYTAPQLDSYLDLETRFEELVRKVLSVKRQQCINKPENIDKLVKETLADFKVAYTQ